MNLLTSHGRAMGYKTAVVLGFFYFLVFTAQSVWRATFHNFAMDRYDITAAQLGLAFSMISLPSLASVLIGLLGGRVRLVILLFASSCAMGGGIITYGTGDLWPELLWGSISLHLGFAVFYPVVNTIILSGTIPSQAVWKLSRLRSLGPLSGIIVASLMIFVLAPLGYSATLTGLGSLVVLAGAGFFLGSPLRKKGLPQNSIRLDRAILPYYALNFLNGCRSGLFKAFVPFYLISEFGFQLKTTATIVLMGNLMTFLGYHICGTLAARYNPARILALIYLVLFLNFFGFFFIKKPEILALLFLIDSLVFCTPALLDGFLKYSTKDRDLLGNLSAGLSLFHLGGVIMPLLGGFLYDRINIHVFLLGSLFAVISLWISISLTLEGFGSNISE